MRPVHNRSQQRQRGSALVEMAMVLPLLALMLFGVVNLGLLIREHQVLQNAAREGARYSSLQANQIDGATDPTCATDTAMCTTCLCPTTNAIKDRVVTYLARENITIARTAVTVNQKYRYTAGAVTVDSSQVTVTYSRTVLMGASWLWPFGPVQLTGQSVFRNQY